MELSKQQWNDFVRSIAGGSFLQSWEWGEVQKELTVPYWRISSESGEQVTGAALVIKYELPMRKCWLYVPRGPVVNHQYPSPNSEKIHNAQRPTRADGVLKQLEKLARRENAVFVRTEPSELPGEGWVKADRDIQPANTIVMDLDESEEELLARMHQKTRYNIRLAERKGVRIRFSQDEEDLEKFISLAGEVSIRSPFRYHSPEHYRAMIRNLASAGMMEIAVAEFEGQALAVHLLVKFGDTVTYVHGASSSKKRELMAPHLLQWESIKRAKEQGVAVYDFYGVSPIDAGPNHPWAGIKRFKEGFGGRRVDYPGAWDYILEPTSYWLFNTARKMKKVLG